MTATLERLQTEALPEQPLLPAEAATDEPPSASLEELANAAETMPENTDLAPSATSEIAPLAAAERQKLRERIGKSGGLSRGLRDRLAALLDGESAAGTDSEPLVRAESVLALLEEAIPPQLRMDASALAQPEHPAGEAFFTGDPNQMTDDQAERIAREQLAREVHSEEKPGLGARG